MKRAMFGGLAWDAKKKVTRRERFLGEMDAVILWSRLQGLVESHAPKDECGRPPKPLPVMRRIYLMQRWINLSHPQAEDGLYDSEAMRRSAGPDLADDAIRDEAAIRKFRHVLEQPQLTKEIFEAVRDLLDERRRPLRSGTIVDATLIAAPPSTKNRDQARDAPDLQGQAVALRNEAVCRYGPRSGAYVHGHPRRSPGY